MSDDLTQKPAVAGFRVRIAYADGTVIEDSDTWASWSAGGESLDSCDEGARKVSGGRKYTNIVLKRGADTNRAIYKWWQKVQTDGAGAAANGTIDVFDAAGKVIHTYAFKQGFPIKWQGASINAQSNEMAIESITIAHEGLELS